MRWIDKHKIFYSQIAAMTQAKPIDPSKTLKIRQIQNSFSKNTDILHMLTHQCSNQHSAAFHINLCVGRHMPDTFCNIMNPCFYINQSTFRHLVKNCIDSISHTIPQIGRTLYHHNIFFLFIWFFLYFPRK